MAFKNIKFKKFFNAVLAAFHGIWYINFSFNFKYLLISFENSFLTSGLFKSVLIGFQIFTDFVVILLLAISSLILLSRDLCIISILYTLLRFTLWPKICIILVNVPCEIENDMYFIVLGSQNQYMSIKSKAVNCTAQIF